ncbi:SMI1/KNR4 family protein [Streptomyces sp. BI20]|uniref:SMI1/KNR4 family protein n=1 Tax=Streptomyces sp. BI20 TaxID=3403460 RepID=UPI003C789298
MTTDNTAPVDSAAVPALPEALAALTRHEFCHDYDDENDEYLGVDYEPYDAFSDAAEIHDWLVAWTGNAGLTPAGPTVAELPVLPFAQDGAGGQAALWLVREGRPLAEQPVVFLGSEGETGVIAPHAAALLWLLAEGVGPREAVEWDEPAGREDPGLLALALRHAPGPRRTAAEVVAAARAEFPDFEDTVGLLCR